MHSVCVDETSHKILSVAQQCFYCKFMALATINHSRSSREVLDVASKQENNSLFMAFFRYTRVGTLIMATIYLQLIQKGYMFRSFTVLQCSHQHCVQPVASDVEVVGYL